MSRLADLDAFEHQIKFSTPHCGAASCESCSHAEWDNWGDSWHSAELEAYCGHENNPYIDVFLSHWDDFTDGLDGHCPLYQSFNDN